MAGNIDWLPGTRTDILAMVGKWIKILGVKAAEWKVPPEVREELIVLEKVAAEALLTAREEETRTPVSTANCRATFDALEVKMRDTKRRYFLIPPLTEADLIALGLSLHKNPSSIPTPQNQAEAELTFPGIHMVRVENIRPIAGGIEEDRSDYGVRICYGLFGEPTETHPFRLKEMPARGNLLPYNIFTRRHKETFNFEGESGNRIVICLRFESGKSSGENKGAGPYGPFITAVIP
jgi:hypothetical protein